MKNKLFASMVLICASFVFYSCTSPAKIPELNKVYVTNTNRVDLLPVNAITESIEQYQYFEGDFGQRSFASMLYLQADDTGIQVMVLNEMGVDIGSMVYDGKSAVMDSALFPKQLKCEYIILDLQNAYCDASNLKEHYKKYGLDFNAGDGHRTISKKNELIEEIIFQGNNIQIINHLRGYTYRLTGQN